MGARCYWLEPTSRVRVSLRRRATGSRCPSTTSGVHDVRVPIVVRDDLIREDGVVGCARAEEYEGDPRWPTACPCGYAFGEDDARQTVCERLYERRDTGELITLQDAPPGAVYDALSPPGKDPDERSLIFVRSDESSAGARDPNEPAGERRLPMSRDELLAAGKRIAADLDETEVRLGPFLELVADELGLVEDVVHRDTTPAHPLDQIGVGVFVRQIADWPIELLARFDWACVAVLTSGRAIFNDDDAWWADARAAGVKLTAMDWLPSPMSFRPNLERAIDWSVEQGSLCWVVDAETPGPPRGWSGRQADARRYVEVARRSCDRAGCGLGFTGIAMLPRRPEWRVFVEGCDDLLIPQPYDRWGAYEADYTEQVLDRWRELGARADRLVIGRGAFVDPDGRGPARARWRSPSEIERHRATTPPGLPGECWWPPAGRMSSRVAGAIVDAR